jgi:putative zinc finger protein
VDCDRVRERMQALVDGELDAAETTRARRHVRACESCSDDVGSLEATLRALGAGRDAVPPPGLAAEIADAVWEQRAPVRRRRVPPVAWFAVGAASAVAAGLLVWLALRAGSVERPSPLVAKALPPADVMEPLPVEGDDREAVALDEPSPRAESESDFAPREIDPPLVAFAEEEPGRPIPMSEPTWPTIAAPRPPAAAASIDARTAPAPVPDLARSAVSVVVHDDGAVEMELCGPVSERIPALVSLLSDRDRRVNTVARQELSRISQELVRSGVLPRRSLEPLASRAAPKASVIDKLCGLVPDAPSASSEERWSSWWEEHREAIVATSRETTSTRGGF